MLEVDVKRAFPGFRLEVRFEAGPGGITALFGRSGAGKTTLVNLLAGLDRPEAGRIAVNGEVMFDKDAGIEVPPERRRLGYVFQEDRLFPHLSVHGNLVYGMRLVPPAERRVDFRQVVDLLGIGHLLQRRPRRLSGGEKQRVAIGRALLTSPRMLLMDEPLASLDAGRRAEILPFIESLRDDLKMPVVYVSHNMEEVIRLADWVVLLSDGQAAAVGPVEQVMSRLDLRPMTGRHEAGAVLAVTVAGHDEAFQLTHLAFPGGELKVSRLPLAKGGRLRVRVRARDVTLALTPPRDISFLNVISGTVAEVAGDQGPQVDVLLRLGDPAAAAGESRLWARITRRSAHDLGLAPGTPVYALIKAIAFDRHNLGLEGTAGRFLEE
jgi:molybdate transport system ATP-binding protein